MLFNSFEFILYYLPITLAGYFFFGKYYGFKFSIIWLTIASIIFYAWWEPSSTFLLLGSIIINYTFGNLLTRNPLTPKIKKYILVSGICFNVMLLCYFKYTSFILDNINTLLNTNYILQLTLPLAISFFTFTQIAYLVDASRGKAKETSFINYCLFVTFFPHLIAGPIIHHKEMMPQFLNKSIRMVNWQNIFSGIILFLVGFIKKVFIADYLSKLVMPVFAASHLGDNISCIDAWVGSISFMIQIYADFSGYTDMALGLGLMFNIKMPINFNSPYKATSIIELWNRWHITLTRFLTDYIYSPIAIRLARYSIVKSHSSIMSFCMSVGIPVLLTFLISGIWHGAGWNFIIFGLINGLAIVINNAWREFNYPNLPKVFCWLITMFVFLIGLIFFRAESVESSFLIIKELFGLSGFSQDTLLPRSSKMKLLALSLFILILPNIQIVLQRFKPSLNVDEEIQINKNIAIEKVWDFFELKNIRYIGVLSLTLGLLVGVGMIYALMTFFMSGETLPEFIYFKF